MKGSLAAGKASGGLVKGALDYWYRYSDHKSCKKIHKMCLEDFRVEDSTEMLASTFCRVFQHYNIQFCELLRTEDLEDSWENAMNKLATDAVHRIFDGLEKKSGGESDKTKVMLFKSLAEFTHTLKWIQSNLSASWIFKGRH